MSNTVLEKLLTTKDAAETLGLSIRRLERHRIDGTGPAYIKLSAGRPGRVRYCGADLTRWIADRRHDAPESVAPVAAA